jgi:hypothetical protein
MKRIAISAMALALSLPASAALAERLPTKPGSNPSVITISCFRGPTANVIWDRPNAVFIEDLVRLGYSYPQAQAIAERVCRDEYGVGRPDYMKATLLELMSRTPPKK